MASDDGTATATLAGGCFWCLQPVFDELEGVVATEVGYSGGHVPDPSYRAVCTGNTGHAEAVRVVFDPEVVSYQEILEVFFAVHDPTTRNRQGPDVGTQYRSAVFVHDEDQRNTAERVIQRLEEEGVWNGIVTEVEPFDAFYPAEEYHQDYYRKNPEAGYCRAIVAPKVAKFRKRFSERLKA